MPCSHLCSSTTTTTKITLQMATPGNPLLVGILQEWYEAAKAQNSKGAATYKRAYESMKACPLTFSHPSEAIQLHGIGPQLCVRLTAELEAHCRANGLPLPKKPVAARARTNAQAVIEHQTETVPPQPARRPQRKPYVPAYRSGAYALLISLYTDDGMGDGIGRTKQELIESAREHCDASFDAPADKGRYYTAWASMKTLLDKNLVYARGNPKRYLLTEGGEDVASGVMDAMREKAGDRVDAAVEAAAAAVNLAQQRTAPSGSAAVAHNTATAIERIVTAPRNLDGGAGAQSLHQSRTGVTRRRARPEQEEGSDDSVRQGPLVNRRKRQRGAMRISATSIYGKELGEDEDEESTDMRTRSQKMADRKTQRSRMQLMYSGEVEEYGAEYRGDPSRRQLEIAGDDVENAHRRVFNAKSPPPLVELAGVRTRTTDRNRASLLAPPSRTTSSLTDGSQFSQSAAPSRTISAVSISDRSTTTASRTISAVSLPNLSAASSRTATAISLPDGNRAASISPNVPLPTFAAFTPTVWLAGTFTVELILDTREIRTTADREYLQNNLKDMGVVPTTRALQVGDALWIAREKSVEGREVVLDYILERKRLDDLVGSIKDGRFHEQKFRLAKSGVENVIYLVEDVTLRDVDASMQEAIDTAIASTQVVNNFFVKHTAKLDDTIRYLARLTKSLQGLYCDKDLYIVPDKLVESRTYSHLQTHLKEVFPGKQFYLTYTTFSSLVSKSASITLRDVFLKMLMCVRGVSVEKALEIQSRFGTPSRLIEAYEACAGKKERDMVVANASAGAVGRRKIGSTLSVKIADVWWGDD
jgi:crossover junction endonuclease MUS81